MAIAVINIAAHAADISYRTGNVAGVDIGIIIYTGTITVGDFKKLIDVYDAIPNKGVYLRFVVSTKGGSVSEAMKIGRWLRNSDIEFVILPNTECTSACIYMLAGARKRYVAGDIGIHRPYHATSGGSAPGRDLKETYNKSKEYFEEMNTSPSLVEDMFSTEPEDVKYLTISEAKKYRIFENDYIENEESDLRAAKSLGISRKDYMYFNKIATRKCESDDKILTREVMTCYNNEMNRLINSLKKHQ